jgi:uncharacterized repeat protein (TIGR01451 family)
MTPRCPLSTLPRALPAFFILSIFPTVSPVAAQDLCAGLVTDKSPHPMTALAKPAVGQAVVDPQFGTTIRRISAAPSGGVIKPMYSTISAWNADESRLILYRVGQGHQLYDGRTYQFLRSLDIAPADVEQVYWHTTDPDVLFYVDGNRFIRYHVSSGVKDTLTTFTFCSAASGGGDPMYISWDSRRIGLGCGDERFVYDMSTNAVVGRKTMTGSGIPQIAPSGNLAYHDGRVVDASLNTLRTLALANPWEHASLGRLASGHDTYNGVGYDGPEGALATLDLTDGTARVIVGPATGWPYPPSTIHVSAMAYKRPGWVTVSIVGNPNGQDVLHNEIVLADTNPGGKVCRVAHHRSWADEGSVGYWAEPHAVASPSGTRILFGSDWGNSGTVDAFVVELPAYNGSRDGDLSLSASASSNPVAHASGLAYTLTARNGGATSIPGVTLTEVLPAGFAFVSATSGCTEASGTVTCALGALAGGASRAVTVNVHADAVGVAVARGSVAGTSADPDSSNNTVTTSTSVWPTVSIGDATVTEGNSGTTSAEVTVSLSAGSASTVTVALATANGTATAGSDYAAASGTLAFSPGSIQRTVTLTVGGDTTAEPNETFGVNLSSPANAFVGDGSGQVTIVNDDALPPAGEAVAWVDARGVSVSAGVLTKTAATAWGNAGAASSRAINGTGAVEFTLPSAPGYAMFGLGNGDTDQGYADVDFAFYTYPPTGQILIYEKGVKRGSLGAYAPGDKLRISLESGVVKYWWRGVPVYVSGQVPALPLRVDTSLYSVGAAVQGASLTGTLITVALRTEAVAWQRAAGVSPAASTLTKTAVTAWGNAGASSTRGVPAGSAGYAEFTVPASPGYAMFGLSNGDTDLGYADVDYAFYTYPATGRLLVVEKGVSRASLGAYAPGDKLRVSVEAGVVRYWWRGVIVYTSGQAPTFPLRVDTSLYSTGALLLGATLGGSPVATP